jgi:hypothetical protein
LCHDHSADKKDRSEQSRFGKKTGTEARVVSNAGLHVSGERSMSGAYVDQLSYVDQSS